MCSVLQNHTTRHKYIDMIQDSQKDNTDDYIYTLSELDEYSKGGELVGTKLAYVQGILNR